MKRVRKKRDVYDDGEEGNSSGKVKPKRIFTTFMLRKWNKQWRIMSQYSHVFKKTKLTGDDIVDKKDLKKKEVEKKKKEVEEKIANLTEKLGNLSVVDKINVQKTPNKGKKDIDEVEELLPSEVRDALKKRNTSGASKRGRSKANDGGEEVIDLSNRIITQNPDGTFTVNENLKIDQSPTDSIDNDAGENDDEEEKGEEEEEEGDGEEEGGTQGYHGEGARPYYGFSL